MSQHSSPGEKARQAVSPIAAVNNWIADYIDQVRDVSVLKIFNRGKCYILKPETIKM